MPLIIHADDFGASHGVTDDILDAFDQGVLTSTSILVNGHAFDYALAQQKKRPGLRLGIHLNLVEGRPLLSGDDVSLLVDRQGTFKHSFLSLWLAYLGGTAAQRLLLRTQVKNELKAQITKFKDAAGKDIYVAVDSHQHLHLIPFVSDVVVELVRECGIHYIRMPQERFFLFLRGNNFFKIYCSSNIVKHVLLNILSFRAKRCLGKTGVDFPAFFIGVLFTGEMSLEVVQAAAAKIIPLSGSIEILFHPGKALPDEIRLWQGNKLLEDYYLSPKHTRELQELKRAPFKSYLERQVR